MPATLLTWQKYMYSPSMMAPWPEERWGRNGFFLYFFETMKRHQANSFFDEIAPYNGFSVDHGESKKFCCQVC